MDQGLGELADMQTYRGCSAVHAGETVGSMRCISGKPELSAHPRTFTLLLAQATAIALHRARSYDAELDKRTARSFSHSPEDVLGVVAHDSGTVEPDSDDGGADRRRELPVERRKEMLGIALRAAKQMNRLIEDLLDHVRLQAGRLSLASMVYRPHHHPDAEETFRHSRPASRSLRDDRGWRGLRACDRSGVADRRQPDRKRDQVHAGAGIVKLRATPDDKQRRCFRSSMMARNCGRNTHTSSTTSGSAEE